MTRNRNPLQTARPNLLDITVDSVPVRALIDTGAHISVMSADFRRRLRKVLTPATSRVRVADGGTPTVDGLCTARVTIAGHSTPVQFTVLSSCAHHIILGLDFLADHSALIDCSQGVLHLDLPQVDPEQALTSLRLHSSEYARLPSQAASFVLLTPSCPVPDGDYIVAPILDLLLTRNVALPHTIATIKSNAVSLPFLNFSYSSQVLPLGICVATLSPLAPSQVATFDATPVRLPVAQSQTPPLSIDAFKTMMPTDLCPDQTDALRHLLESFSDIFDISATAMGQALSVTHRIDTGDAPPIRRRPYRVSHAERQVINAEVAKMLAKDIIEPSYSPWASPVVLVKKKDGSWRFCIDYRHLNKITKKDVYPLPRIDDALDCLHGAKFFSSIDLRSGYWQIAVDAQDREKTAFVTPDGLYQFKVMPFGLCNAPATFERMMDALLHGFKWSTCLCYLDDVIVFSPTFSAHLADLSQILSLFRHAGLQLNSSKCRFARRQITILGHVVNSTGVHPDPDKIRAVEHFPLPRSCNDVRSFLGLCSYFRRFVEGFADLARPLTDLLKKDVTFFWGPNQDRAFTTLISKLTTSPVLAHFDVAAPTELRTDASGYGIGAVLSQRQSGQDRVIAYASRLLSTPERNYSITERECLALVWAIGKFRPYLYGRTFTVVTDHHALCWLSSLKDPTGRLGRWALRLQEYDYTVLYKSGRLHKDADCLSRYPVGPCDNPSIHGDADLFSLSAFAHMGEEQRRDAELRSLIARIRSTPSDPPLRRFVLHNDTLYRRTFNPAGPDLVLVVPKHLRTAVLQELHDLPTAGHLGVTRTYDRVRHRFFWPRLHRSVRRYVGACDACQRRKRPTTLSAGMLQPIDVPPEPFYRVGLDLLGPFPESHAGNRWVAVATDYATRYAITRALPTSTATDVADFLLTEVILRHGAPHQLLTDRGRCFLSKVVDDILRSCSTKHKLTTAYHPQTNGLTERLNRTLTDMLAMYVSPDHRDWDVALPYVTFAYNSSRHDTAGYSPFYLLYGREPHLPLDTLLPPSAAPPSEYAHEAIARADHARQLARSRLLASQTSQQESYNRRHRTVSFSPGSLVLLWTPSRRLGLSEKLLSRYVGPYRVLRQVTAVTYEIAPASPETTARSAQRDIVHVSRLKPYLSQCSTTP